MSGVIVGITSAIDSLTIGLFPGLDDLTDAGCREVIKKKPYENRNTQSFSGNGILKYLPAAIDPLPEINTITVDFLGQEGLDLNLPKWEDEKFEIPDEFPPEESVGEEPKITPSLPSVPDWGPSSVPPDPEEAFVAPERESIFTSEPATESEAMSLLSSINDFDDNPYDWLRKVNRLTQLGYIDGPLDFLKKGAQAVKKVGSKAVSTVKKAGGTVINLGKKNVGRAVQALKWAKDKLTAIRNVALKYAKSYSKKAFRYAKKGLQTSFNAAKKAGQAAFRLSKRAGSLAWKYGKAATSLAKKYATKAANFSKRLAKRNYDRIIKVKDWTTGKFKELAAQQTKGITTFIILGAAGIAALLLFTGG